MARPDPLRKAGGAPHVPDGTGALASLDATLDAGITDMARGLAGKLDEWTRHADAARVDRAVAGRLTREDERAIWGAWLDYFQDGAWDHVADAYLEGEAHAERVHTELAEVASSGGEYLHERGAEFAQLMADSTMAAAENVRLVIEREEIASVDARLLMAATMWLAPTDAERVARAHATSLAKVDATVSVAKELRPSVLRRVNELVMRRAYRTAEYELARAYNDAERKKYQDGLAAGIFAEVQRTWVTAADDRVCKTCGPLHGVTLTARKATSLKQGWGRPTSERGGPRTAKVRNPPAHIKCRCVVVYRVRANIGGELI